MENPEASIISSRADSIATAIGTSPDNSFSTSLIYRNIYGEECVQNHTSELKFSNPLEVGSRIVSKLNFVFANVFVRNIGGLPLRVVGWEMHGCKIVEPASLESFNLKHLQVVNLCFKISETDDPMLAIHYMTDTTGSDRKLHINADIDKRIR